jgi:glyoxylase-like metal-dependent hydrolase (beta-lactamase superfamily II)
MNSWFRIEKIADRAWMVQEPGHVNSFLVEGDGTAALIDTGLGVESIRDVCTALTSKPVQVLNTHGHFDHIGGDREFREISIHPTGRNRLAAETPPSFLREYFAGDDAAPPGAAAWRIPGVEPTGSLEEGDTVELGGRELRVLHTPGHTPDGCSFLLPDAELLFVGDTCGTRELYAYMVESNVEDFARSAARLANLSGFTRVLAAHDDDAERSASFLDDVAEAFAALTSGTATLDAATDYLGRKVLAARGNGFVILVEDPDHPMEELVAGWTA